MLAKGKRLALAPLQLGSLYDQLDEYVHNIVCSVSRYNVITYVDTTFLQMLLWEKFGFLSPKSIEFETIKLEKVVVNGEEEKTTKYKPKDLRRVG